MPELQTTWGWLVAIYLFMGGLAAGASVVAHLLALTTGRRFTATVRFGAWFSAIALGVGTAALLIDVGQPLRALVLFRSFVNSSSWMMRGAWLLLAAMLVNGLSALCWTERVQAWASGRWRPFARLTMLARLPLAVLALPLNLSVAVYTGLLLGALPFRPLWYTPLLPVLFTVSALDTGVGLVCFYAGKREVGRAGHTLSLAFEGCVVALVLAEGAVLVAFIRQMLAGSPDAVRSISLWLSGGLALPFWAGVVGLGLAVPLLVALVVLFTARLRPMRWLRYAPALAVVGCLSGGWLLRFVVLSAGLPQTLVSPYFLQAVEGIPFIR